MTDVDLLTLALHASGLSHDGKPSVEGFARGVLGASDGANARGVLAGRKALGRSSRVLCMLVVMRPDLVDDVMLAVAALGGEPCPESKV